ncbi:MAG: efflux RND transporter permease subunit [Comamonas sp.]
MKLAEISIRRPVFATVLSLLVVLVGIVSYFNLPVREYPRIDEPIVTVSVTYGGASAEVMETQVSKVLEDSIAGIDGVDILTSISRAERSQVTARFRLDKNPDSAAADVRDRTSRVRGRLPDDIDDPVISKVEADAWPIIWLTFSSDRLSRLALSDIVNRIAKPRLQTATGVAEVNLYGERQYAMRVWLDAERLAAYRLTPADVESAIRANNLELPAGRIESAQREFGVTAQTDLTTPAQFADIVVQTVNGFAVHLRDVARVEEAALDERSTARINGRDAVMVGITRQATANPLDLSQAVRAMLPQVEEELGGTVTVQVANDSSVFIERSIHNVYRTIVEAVLLVALVIFVFLRTLRASIIPIITIPVSLVGTFALMALAGFSINTLTLLALVLAIGLVVDDAIVVLENIYRHIEEGMAPFQAALKGAREVGFAIVAMTLTLAAVYAPLAFTPGRTGRLFVEFALALAGSVLVSGFIALTLSPMMCSLLLKHNPQPGRFDRFMERRLTALSAGYGRWLGGLLAVRHPAGAGWLRRHLLQPRGLVVLAMLLVAVAIALVYPRMRSELAPVEDQGVISARITAPDGATLAYTDRYTRQVERLGEVHPEFDRIFTTVGRPVVTNGSVTFRAVDWEDRSRSMAEIFAQMRPGIASVAGADVILGMPLPLGQGARERPVNYVILTSDSYENLNRVSQAMLAAMNANPGLLGPESDLELNKPELRLEVDRERAADLGVQVSVVAAAIETMLGGRTVTRYKKNAEQYDVIVQTAPTGRSTPEDIARIYVRGSRGDMIALSSLVKVSESAAPRELNHFGQRRAVVLKANLAADYPLGEALAFMDRTAAEVLQPGYSTDLNGASREFRNSQGALGIVFALALVFIFLVLAAQFESFVDPLVILLSVPLSMIGALLALQWSGGSLNVYSQIGLITLVGLITKHGILIVEFANQLRQQGRETVEAIVEAASTRLRPILMTTGAMVLGVVPLALASGAGAESRQQIGWVIIGGMSLGTLLTLFVVPVVYTLLARRRVPGERGGEAVQAMPQGVHAGAGGE